MSSPAVEPKKKGILGSLAPFPRPFWVINTVELFERGAYYGMLAVLSVFMTSTLGIPAEQTGILLAIQFPLLYFLPLFAAALADKVGYKTVLVFSFLFLIGGYTALYFAQDFSGILLGVTLYGIGAGAFKPIPAATVSQTTSVEDRNFGFSIYYWLINLGAFIFPIGMGLVFDVDYRPYFLVSVGLSVLNLFICLGMWKNLKPADKSVRVGAALARLVDLFRHPAFLVLLVIYSGFWFMYAMTTSFMTVYMVEFGVLSASFVPLVIALNALTIIALGPILGKLTNKVPSIPLMIGGIATYVAGFVLLGFSPFASLFIAGIVVYSIGEFLTHPGFLSYVSKVAPPDRVAVFLGYGFIPIGIGQFTGTLAGGFLYGSLAQDLGKPQLFWAVISSMGLVTIAAMLLYNRFVSPKAPAEAKPRRRGVAFLAGPGLAAVVILLVPALVAAGTFAPAQTGTAPGGATGLASANLATVALPEISGSTEEGARTSEMVTIPANLSGAVTFTLSWTDEAASQPGASNAPDSFRVHVQLPDGTMAMSEEVANGGDGNGAVVLTVEGLQPGDVMIEVELVDAGDTSVAALPLVGPAPVGGSADTGNAWTLLTSYQASA